MNKFRISFALYLRFLFICGFIFLFGTLYSAGLHGLGSFFILIILACLFMVPVLLITPFVIRYIFSLPYSFRSCFVFFSFVFVLPVELVLVISICSGEDTPGKMVMMAISAFQALSLIACYLCRTDLLSFYNEQHKSLQFNSENVGSENGPHFDYYQSGLN